MNPAYATPRPSRLAAGALLLALHVLAILLLVSLHGTLTRPRDEAVTWLLAVLPQTRRVEPAPALPAPSHPPRARTARARAVPPQPTVPTVPVAPPAAVQPVPPGAPTPAPAAPATPSGPPGDVGGGAAAPGGRLDLHIPRDFYDHPPPLTAGQEAMRDPRSNRLVLTKHEQLQIDFGEVECIAWQREPDGSIYRGPGHWQRVQDVDTNPFNGKRAQECVK